MQFVAVRPRANSITYPRVNRDGPSPVKPNLLPALRSTPVAAGRRGMPPCADHGVMSGRVMDPALTLV